MWMMCWATKGETVYFMRSKLFLQHLQNLWLSCPAQRSSPMHVEARLPSNQLVNNHSKPFQIDYPGQLIIRALPVCRTCQVPMVPLLPRLVLEPLSPGGELGLLPAFCHLLCALSGHQSQLRFFTAIKAPWSLPSPRLCLEFGTFRAAGPPPDLPSAL